MNEANDFLAACDKQRQLLGKMRMLWAYHKLHEVDDAENHPGAKEWHSASIEASENMSLLGALAKRAVDAVKLAKYDPAMLFELAEAAGSWERFNQAMRKNVPALRAAAALAGLVEETKAESTTAEVSQDPDDELRLSAIGWWNAGKSWREVTRKMGRSGDQSKATEMELKRFAEKNGITIRIGKPGAKRSGGKEQ